MWVVQEYEEHLLREGLITEDMCDRIVTSLPKCLSDSTMRGSRESLRGSTDTLWRAPSTDSVSTTTTTSRLSTDAISLAPRRRFGHWKMLKRVVSRWIEVGHRKNATHRLLTSFIDRRNQTRCRLESNANRVERLAFPVTS